MASLTIVSGCPGTGKTTLAALLSTASPRGLRFAAAFARQRAAGELRLDLAGITGQSSCT